ncbi:MAG: hypothetical protein JXB88_05845 [Spirochaetales bacterium]|nr:hypothetical protein [Spirochaetales bacterium]
MASLRRPIFTFTNDEKISDMYLYAVFQFTNDKPEKVWEYFLKEGLGFYPEQQDKPMFIPPGEYSFFISKKRLANPEEKIKEGDCVKETVLTSEETGGLAAQTIKLSAPYIISTINDNPPLVFVKQAHITTPHRLPVKLELIGESDAKAQLTCDSQDDIIIYDVETGGVKIDLPYEIEAESLKQGMMIYVEAKNPKLQVGLDLSPSGEESGTGLKIDCIQVTLNIHKCREQAGTEPAAFTHQEKIEPGRFLHEQDADLHHERGLTVLQEIAPDDFTGKITLYAADSNTGDLVDNLVLYDEAEETPQDGQTPKANPFEIDYTQKGKHTFWLQGNKVSSEMKDVCLRVGAPGLTNEAGKNAYGDEVKITVIKTDLELGKSRSAAGSDPDIFAVADKMDIGRYLHIQDPGHHHGRAMVRIKKFTPDSFVGKFMLTAYNVDTGTGALSKNNPGIELYDDEVAAGGQAAHPNELEVDHTNTFPAEGKLFWVQGKSVSGDLRDRQLHLGIKDHIKTMHKAAFTVVRFKDLKAVIKSTEANTPRLGNSPVLDHDLHIASGALSATEFDVNINVNEPLPLIEGSILHTNPVELSVVVEPAGVGVPVLWAIKRDRRPAPDGDAAGIISLAGNQEAPTITQDGADPLKATCIADAVGTFHICPYIDCNGSGDLDFTDNTGQRIDREPHIIMNYLLFRIKGRQNNSLARPANHTINPANPTTATGVGISAGGFANGAGAGVHSKADVEVTGGGSDGKRGLDYLFGGWINNLTNMNVRMNYVIPGPPAVNHFMEFQCYNHGTGIIGPTMPSAILPAPLHPVAFLALPVLDVSPFGNEGEGGNRAVGTEGGIGPPGGIVKIANPAGIGEIWTIEMWDSPGAGAPAHHSNPAYAGTVLESFVYNLGFRVDLCFWTNRSKVAGHMPDDPACRVYSSVQTNTWEIEFEIQFNINTGVSNITTPYNIVINKDGNATRLATPVQNSGLEVRFPTILQTVIIDARN